MGRNRLIAMHNQTYMKRKTEVLFFDEIQLISNWEMFVHQLLREGFKVFITGSNASLLSKELGTNLTGRHLSMVLFPFSYAEFCNKKLKCSYNFLLQLRCSLLIYNLFIISFVVNERCLSLLAKDAVSLQKKYLLCIGRSN